MLPLACNEVNQCMSQVDGVALNHAIKKVELLLPHHTDAVRCACKRASNHSMHVPIGWWCRQGRLRQSLLVVMPLTDAALDSCRSKTGWKVYQKVLVLSDSGVVRIVEAHQ